jgi:hypothetical protein
MPFYSITSSARASRGRHESFTEISSIKLAPLRRGFLFLPHSDRERALVGGRFASYGEIPAGFTRSTVNGSRAAASQIGGPPRKAVLTCPVAAKDAQAFRWWWRFPPVPTSSRCGRT